MLKQGWCFHPVERRAGEILNKQQSSSQTRSIRISINDKKDITLSTQLDDELTIQILEVCLKLLKDKASQ